MTRRRVRLPRTLAAVVFVATAALSFGAPDASAQTRGHAGPGGDFGAGLVLGTPTGLTAEYFVDQSNAVRAGVGLDVLDEQTFYLHLDWRGVLWAIADRRTVRLPLYVGLGGFLAATDLDVFGLRAPLGFGVDFSRAPVQLFFELTPQLAITNDDWLDPRLGAAFGLQVYF